MSLPILTIVVPCFNEELAIPEFYLECKKCFPVLSGRCEVEYLFIVTVKPTTH